MRARAWTLPVLVAGAAVVTTACGDDPAGPGDAPPATVEAVSVSLDVQSETLTALGDTLTLTATARDSAGVSIADADLTWETSAPGVATVTPEGAVIAQGNGAATIRVRAGEARDSAWITVAQRAEALEFRQQPADTLQAEALAAVTVAVVDARGNPVATESGVVTLSLTPSGTLEGTTSAQLVDGIATFDDVAVAEGGSGYRLEAAYGDLAAVASDYFDVHLALARLSAGGLHTCASTTRGETYCWGLSADGRLGDGTIESRDRPVLVTAAESLRMVDAGSPGTWALDAAGVVYGWGAGTLTPTTLTAPVPFDTITTRWHTCAIAGDGTAYCWGESPAAFGGGSSTEPAPSPTVAMDGETVLEIGTGSGFTCALHADRTAWCAGNNPNGELGNGTTNHSSAPTPVLGNMAFSRLAVGHEFACGITVDGPTYCWGANGSGQLGSLGAGDYSAQPVEVAGGHSFTKLSLGQDHACALTADGTAYCWGSPSYGQLGVDLGGPVSEPTAVSGGLAFREISAASFHTCGIADDGYTYCWGNNANGELGDGGGPAGATPRRIAAPWL